MATRTADAQSACERRHQRSARKLSEQFRTDYDHFVSQFDALAADLFQGHKLERLASVFLSKHMREMREIPFARSDFKFPKCSASEALDEDLRIITVSAPMQEGQLSDEQRMLTEVHRRACEAVYLRVTFNKSRLEQEDDRREPVEWARWAIRWNADDFQACYWFMIALGWWLDATTNAKERTLLARLFKESTLRCQRIRPEDPLAYNLLGRYYYSVAGLSWLERTIAKNLLGCKLEGSYADAERAFRAGHKLANWLPTGVWMARTLQAQKRPLKEILEWIEFGLAQDCKEPTTEIERRELLELRAKLFG